MGKYTLGFLFVVFISFQVSSAQFVIPDELKEEVQLLHNTCRNEVNIAEDIIQQSRGGYLPEDKQLQCYIHCLFEKSGLIDKHGELRLDLIFHLLPTELREILDSVMGKCATIHGSNKCETAWLTVKCYFEADPEHSMLI